MKTGNPEGKVVQDFYGRIDSPFRLINNKVIIPDQEEQERNPRSRSAKLRIAERDERKEIKEDQEAKADSKTAETPAPQELGKKAKEAKETKASQKPQDSQDSDDPKEPAEEEEHEESFKEAIAKQAIEDEAPLSSSFTLRKILGGDILTAQVIRRQIWLIVLVVFFIIIYISNRYSIQQDMIEIDQLQEELQNAKYKALSSSSQITERSRESNVLKCCRTTKTASCTLPPSHHTS